MTLPSSLAPSASSDEDLLLLARRGRVEAKEELLRRHRQGAYLVAYQILGNPEDAKDAVQDSLIKFLTHLDRIQKGRPIKPWLYTIVRNRCRDLLRRKKVRKWVPLTSDDDQWRPELVDPKEGPDETTERKALQAKVWKVVSDLPLKQREIIILRDYQDLSYSEISEVLSLPQGTVMSRLHRARQQLATALRAEFQRGEQDDS